MKQTQSESVQSVAAMLKLLNRHRAEIITALLGGTKRFGEIRAELGGVAQKTLSDDLHFLEAKGMLTRRVYAEVPPRVEYTLTPAGLKLKPLLHMMADMGSGQPAAECTKI